MAKRSEDERQAAALPVAARFDSLADDQLVRVRDVAALLSCSVSTVWRLRKAGRIPPPKQITPGLSTWRMGDLRGRVRKDAE
jgi:predicted DNA-binding transcriptional regulator AlpA